MCATVLVDVVTPIYVVRGERESREVAQNEIIKRTKEPDWPPIMIFVEGNVAQSLFAVYS